MFFRNKSVTKRHLPDKQTANAVLNLFSLSLIYFNNEQVLVNKTRNHRHRKANCQNFKNAMGMGCPGDYFFNQANILVIELNFTAV